MALEIVTFVLFGVVREISGPSTDRIRSSDLPMDHLKEAEAYCRASGATTDQVKAVALVSIAQSLDDLAKMAKRIDPLLARLEEEFAKTEDGKPLRPLEDHAA